MLKKHLHVAAVLVFAASLVVPLQASAAQRDFKQSVTAEPFSADVWILPAGQMDYEIYVTFHSDDLSRPAGCMSVYRDFTYRLVADNGSVVPIDHQAIVQPPPDATIVLHAGPNDVKARSAGHCGEVRGFSQSGSRTFVSTLYPHLKAGAYSLMMTFTPHWLSNHVPLPIVRIVLPTGVGVCRNSNLTGSAQAARRSLSQTFAPMAA